MANEFQFTHPGRGATVGCGHRRRGRGRFNSRTPGGVRHRTRVTEQWIRSFNSRTPGGVRRWRGFFQGRFSMFQFTHPGRGATPTSTSIAALSPRFNSRTPGGVRLEMHCEANGATEFQFTHPGRGATPQRLHRKDRTNQFQFTHPGRGATDFKGLSGTLTLVSIHAPREGCDIAIPLRIPSAPLFQFTHPGRGATAKDFRLLTFILPFQFTHPGRGATLWKSNRRYEYLSFNSRTPGGVRLPTICRLLHSISFNSRTPGGVRPARGVLFLLLHLFQFTHPGRGATGDGARDRFNI